ncbi:hypothetical protein [Catellatospora sichuanensis]|nr:hypothetical protein [Catellatospora sichuanensis]
MVATGEANPARRDTLTAAVTSAMAVLARGVTVGHDLPLLR